MHLPLNRMILKDPAAASAIPIAEQRDWYEPIFQALGSGGQVLICCKNGMHRSRRKGYRGPGVWVTRSNSALARC